jgi:glycerol-3-phosphate dehydrogenase (NAD(P)+)
MNICFVGAGAWGTALAVFAGKHHDCMLFARDPVQAEQLARERINRRYLDGVAFPDGLAVTADLAAALAGAELVVIATPVAGMREAAERLRPLSAAPLIWLCKGFEEGTALLPHEIAAQTGGNAPGASLSGPSFALEVARGQPTALTVASSDARLIAMALDAFHHQSLRVYSSDDIVGVEVGGALKNVLAIATGICDGLELGLNARAALITRGLAEMMRLGEALGARAETLTGLSGLGDLILTSTGALSRNRRVGLALGQGQPLDQSLAGLGHVAEGVRCAKAVLTRAQSVHIEMPICEAVHAVLFAGLAPKEAVAGLLARAPRAESVGH